MYRIRVAPRAITPRTRVTRRHLGNRPSASSTTGVDDPKIPLGMPSSANDKTDTSRDPETMRDHRRHARVRHRHPTTSTYDAKVFSSERRVLLHGFEARPPWTDMISFTDTT